MISNQMRKYTFFIGVLIMLIVSSAVAASGNARESRERLKAFAQCVINLQQADARRILIQNLNNPEIDGIFKEKSRGCADFVQVRKLKFPNDTFSYALAEALYDQDFLQTVIPSFVNVPPLGQIKNLPTADQVKNSAFKSKEKFSKADTAVYNEMNSWSRVGECVTRSMPLDARDLLRSEYESETEAAVFLRLKPVFINCLERGDNIKFDKSSIRGTIAKNLFRLMTSANNMGAFIVRDTK